MSTQPLQSTLDHIQNLESDIDSATRNLKLVPYPRVKLNLEVAGQNYKTGLHVITRILKEYLLARAKQLADRPRPPGAKPQTLDEILRKHWGSQLITSYHIAESYRTNFALETAANIPWELYYLVFDIFDEFGFGEKLVFRPGDQFMTESFQNTILVPLEPLLKVGKEPILPGTLEQGPGLPDIQREIKIEPQHAIMYVSGEGRNPVLWPLIVHEAFHLLDNRLGLFQEMEDGMRGTQRLPVLDQAKNEQVNRRWSREIFQDIAAIHYFGPLYAFSLMKYFERLPYIRTIEHPEMSSRLYAASRYLATVQAQHTDYLARALNFCKPVIVRELGKYEQSGELSEQTKKELEMFYDTVTSWLNSRGISLFTTRLRNYVAESSRASEMPEMKDIDQVSYVDPAFTFDEAVDLIFASNVSIALDPTLLLNLVLAVSDQYAPQGYSDRFVDCMSKWRIKKAWNLALLEIR